MVEYAEAIKKPFSDLKTFAIGTVLGAIPLVSLLIPGYALKTAEDVMGKKNKLREWKFEDLGEYAIKLVMYLIISIAYMIIPLLILGAGIGGAVITALVSNASNPAGVGQAILTGMLAGAPVIILGLLLMLIAAILLPMAIMKWLKSGSIKSAIGLGSVVKNALTADYIVSLIVIFVYAIILMIPLAILSFIPLVGLLAGGAYTFCISVTAYTILAQTVKA